MHTTGYVRVGFTGPEEDSVARVQVDIIEHERAEYAYVSWELRAQPKNETRNAFFLLLGTAGFITVDEVA
jgi:hypothetical protein